MPTAKDASPTPARRRPNWNEISERVEPGKRLLKSNPEEYTTWVAQVRLMNQGEDLGQVEPWWPLTLREMHYNGWADGDFGTLLSLLGEGTQINARLSMPLRGSKRTSE